MLGFIVPHSFDWQTTNKKLYTNCVIHSYNIVAYSTVASLQYCFEATNDEC